MATIDIALPDELTQALSPPVCLDLSLPKVLPPRDPRDDSRTR